MRRGLVRHEHPAPQSDRREKLVYFE